MDRIKLTCATCRRFFNGCYGYPGNHSWCWSPRQGELIKIIQEHEEMRKELEERENG